MVEYCIVAWGAKIRRAVTEVLVILGRKHKIVRSRNNIYISIMKSSSAFLFLLIFTYLHKKKFLKITLTEISTAKSKRYFSTPKIIMLFLWKIIRYDRLNVFLKLKFWTEHIKTFTQDKTDTNYATNTIKNHHTPDTI